MWTGLIHNEVLRQCDTLDGVKDGIIEHPDACHFQPEVLQCPSPGAKNCLTPQQVDQVRQIFSPLRYKDQTVIYPGMQPGSELRAIDRLYSGRPFSDSQVSLPHSACV
jgi:feruloyl esterase